MRRLERVYQNGTLAEVDQEELVASFQRTAGQPLSSHSATVSDRQPTAKSGLRHFNSEWQQWSTYLPFK